MKCRNRRSAHFSITDLYTCWRISKRLATGSVATIAEARVEPLERWEPKYETGMPVAAAIIDRPISKTSSALLPAVLPSLQLYLRSIAFVWTNSEPAGGIVPSSAWLSM